MRGFRLDLLKAQQATPEQFEQARSQWIEEVQPLCDETISAVGMFRRGGAVTTKVAGRAGQLGGGLVGSLAGRALAKQTAKTKAGGLPERVLLAVTPSKVYAFDYSFQIARKAKDRESGTPTEAAVWDRSALRCSATKQGTMTGLTIESGGETSTLVGGSAADDPWSQDVMRELGAA